MNVNPYVQFLESWIPGIAESTELHDNLHLHFKLDYTVNSEAKLLGFQLGHHPAGSFFHVIVFSFMSIFLYPKDYRNSWKDIVSFYESYLLGKYFQSVPYWACPTDLYNTPNGVK